MLEDGPEGRTVRNWNIAGKDLDSVLPAISGCAVEVADAMEEYQSASAVRDKGSFVKEEEEEPVIQDKSLAIAKMHPDRMLYEKNIAVTPVSQAIGSEEETEPDVPAAESKEVESGADEKAVDTEKTVGETLYLDSRDKLPFAPPRPLDEGGARGTGGDNSASMDYQQVESSGNVLKHQAPAAKQDDSGWFSWLWPWGDDEDSVQAEQASVANTEHSGVNVGDDKKEISQSVSVGRDNVDVKDGEQQPASGDSAPLWKWN
jgi:hypothetical protein